MGGLNDIAAWFNGYRYMHHYPKWGKNIGMYQTASRKRKECIYPISCVQLCSDIEPNSTNASILL